MGTGRKILLTAMADYRVRGRSIRATCNETGCKFGGKACKEMAGHFLPRIKNS
jgi:hypothetical protein